MLCDDLKAMEANKLQPFKSPKSFKKGGLLTTLKVVSNPPFFYVKLIKHLSIQDNALGVSVLSFNLQYMKEAAML